MPNPYVIIVVPSDNPVTIPVDVPTVPIVGLLLLQEPPATPFDRFVVDPRQAMVTPEMAVGVATTVTIVVV